MVSFFRLGVSARARLAPSMATMDELLVVEISSESESGLSQDDPAPSYTNVWQCQKAVDEAIKTSTDTWKLDACSSVLGIELKSEQNLEQHLHQVISGELYGCTAKSFESLLSKQNRLMIYLHEAMDFDLPEIYDRDHESNDFTDGDRCPLEIWPQEVPAEVHRKVVMKITESARKVHYRMEHTLDLELSGWQVHSVLPSQIPVN